MKIVFLLLSFHSRKYLCECQHSCKQESCSEVSYFESSVPVSNSKNKKGSSDKWNKSKGETTGDGRKVDQPVDDPRGDGQDCRNNKGVFESVNFDTRKNLPSNKHSDSGEKDIEQKRGDKFHGDSKEINHTFTPTNKLIIRIFFQYTSYLHDKKANLIVHIHQ